MDTENMTLEDLRESLQKIKELIAKKENKELQSRIDNFKKSKRGKDIAKKAKQLLARFRNMDGKTFKTTLQVTLEVTPEIIAAEEDEGLLLQSSHLSNLIDYEIKGLVKGNLDQNQRKQAEDTLNSTLRYACEESLRLFPQINAFMNDLEEFLKETDEKEEVVEPIIEEVCARLKR